MAKRLQVILQDPEYREIQHLARARHTYPTADIDRMLSEIESGYGVADRT